MIDGFFSPDGKQQGTFGDSWYGAYATGMFYAAKYNRDPYAQYYLQQAGFFNNLFDFANVLLFDTGASQVPVNTVIQPYASPKVGFAALNSKRSLHSPTITPSQESMLVFKSGPQDLSIGKQVIRVCAYCMELLLNVCVCVLTVWSCC